MKNHAGLLLILSAVIAILAILAGVAVEPDLSPEVQGLVLAQQATPTETPNPGPTPVKHQLEEVFGVWTMPGEPRQVLNSVKVQHCECDDPATCNAGREAHEEPYCDQIAEGGHSPDWKETRVFAPNKHHGSWTFHTGCSIWTLISLGMGATPDDPPGWGYQAYGGGDCYNMIFDTGGYDWTIEVRTCDDAQVPQGMHCYDYDPRYSSYWSLAYYCPRGPNQTLCYDLFNDMADFPRDPHQARGGLFEGDNGPNFAVIMSEAES